MIINISNLMIQINIKINNHLKLNLLSIIMIIEELVNQD